LGCCCQDTFLRIELLALALSKAKQSKAKQSKAKQSKAKQSKAKLCKAGEHALLDDKSMSYQNWLSIQQ
jgi:hypothetical protein